MYKIPNPIPLTPFHTRTIPTPQPTAAALEFALLCRLLQPPTAPSASISATDIVHIAPSALLVTAAASVLLPDRLPPNPTSVAPDWLPPPSPQPPPSSLGVVAPASLLLPRRRPDLRLLPWRRHPGLPPSPSALLPRPPPPPLAPPPRPPSSFLDAAAPASLLLPRRLRPDLGLLPWHRRPSLPPPPSTPPPQPPSSSECRQHVAIYSLACI